jgi:aminoglycoside phosphotransferase (APT) family kinase protein
VIPAVIPEDRREAVSRAMQKAFGTDEIEEIRARSGGLINLAYRMVVRGRPYLLRLVLNTRADPTREFACMQAAAEAGIAPRIWYANTEERILITDFVEGETAPGGFCGADRGRAAQAAFPSPISTGDMGGGHAGHHRRVRAAVPRSEGAAGERD